METSYKGREDGELIATIQELREVPGVSYDDGTDDDNDRYWKVFVCLDQCVNKTDFAEEIARRSPPVGYEIVDLASEPLLMADVPKVPDLTTRWDDCGNTWRHIWQQRMRTLENVVQDTPSFKKTEIPHYWDNEQIARDLKRQGLPPGRYVKQRSRDYFFLHEGPVSEEVLVTIRVAANAEAREACLYHLQQALMLIQPFLKPGEEITIQGVI